VRFFYEPHFIQTPMAPIVLEQGNARLMLRPELGGCIEGLWLGALPIMASQADGALTDVHSSASYPLVPYSNRIAHAQLHWQGTRYALQANFAPEPHAIHGVGWQRAWAVHAARSDFAHLTLQHTADADWPLAFDAWQTFALRQDAEATTLTLTLGMTNRASVTAPAGLGWHPYFVKRATSHIQFDAAGRWEMDSSKLPSAWSATGGLNTSCSTLGVDHCYSQYTGAVLLRDERMQVRMRSDVQHLVVYTTPALGKLAIEPVSHVNNAMNSANPSDAAALGVRSLAPGQSTTATMTLELHAL
jgi:aldose 1-epimerase